MKIKLLLISLVALTISYFLYGHYAKDHNVLDNVKDEEATFKYGELWAKENQPKKIQECWNLEGFAMIGCEVWLGAENKVRDEKYGYDWASKIDKTKWTDKSFMEKWAECDVFDSYDKKMGCQDFMKSNVKIGAIRKPRFKGYLCKDDCSGHKAGYYWASDNEIIDDWDCQNSSKSFKEGCFSFVQEIGYQWALDIDALSLDDCKEESGSDYFLEGCQVYLNERL